jgi:hypothetical protein
MVVHQDGTVLMGRSRAEEHTQKERDFALSIGRVTCASHNGVAGKLCSVSEDHFILEDL